VFDNPSPENLPRPNKIAPSPPPLERTVERLAFTQPPQQDPAGVFEQALTDGRVLQQLLWIIR
jgi:hypothetical protein